MTMGTGVVTFNGNLAATSFTDTSKIAVGENATVTLDGNLEISGSGISRDGTLTTAGAGTVVADYDWTVGDGADSNGYCTMPISVTNTATLALTPGSNII